MASSHPPKVRWQVILIHVRELEKLPAALALQLLVPRLTVVNTVAASDLDQFIDLERLAGAEVFLYDRAVYSCAYFRDEKTRAKVSIFITGRMISVGTKSMFSEPQSIVTPRTCRVRF